jgi:3-methyladenine DNA glycosylase AlkD
LSKSMKTQQIVRELRSMANPKNVEGMARFGIRSKNTLGISIYVLRPMAKRIGKDHTIAVELWSTEIHEARLLAGFIDDPKKVTEKQMEAWAADFDSWDIVDQVCSSLFDKTPFAYAKAVEWSSRKEEFVKRAGFVLMAALSVHDREAPDRAFTRFFPIIKREATDDRNFVKKAVNWALRQIGKRDIALNKAAVKLAKEIQKIDSKSARWIAADALRELESDKVMKRLTDKPRKLNI